MCNLELLVEKNTNIFQVNELSGSVHQQLCFARLHYPIRTNRPDTFYEINLFSISSNKLLTFRDNFIMYFFVFNLRFLCIYVSLVRCGLPHNISSFTVSSDQEHHLFQDACQGLCFGPPSKPSRGYGLLMQIEKAVSLQSWDTKLKSPYAGALVMIFHLRVDCENTLMVAGLG